MNRTSEKKRGVKLLVVVVWLLAGGLLAGRAQSTNLTALLQEGLFAEQGDHDMATAMADYQMLAAQYDKDRQLAATAVFRLGECYRAQNQTNEAVAQYERILRDFGDQKVLVTMSEENLKGLGGGSGGHLVERLNKIVARVPPGEAVSQGGPNPELVHELEMVKKLQGMTNFDDVVQQAPTLVPDATLNNLINQYNQSELDILRLSTDFGPDSNQMKKAGTIKDGLIQTILKRLEGLKQALMTELAAGGGGGTAGGTASGSTAEVDLVQNDLLKLKAKYSEFSNLNHEQARALVQQDYPNPVMTGLMQELLDAQQRYALLTNEYAESNMVTVRTKNLIDTINPQIDAQVAAVKEALQLKMQLDEAELSGLHLLVDKAGAESATPAVAGDEDQEIQRIQEMVRNSPDLINAASGDGNNTPLSKAAANGWLKVAAYLLDHGAQVNPPGTSPLDAATHAGNRAMVEFLLSRGAEVNGTDSSAETPLQVAVSKKFKSVVEVLLTNGADVNLASSMENRSPLHLAASGPDSIVRMLLAAGARVNVEDQSGQTPLSIAADSGKPETIQLLLAAKADPNMVSGNAKPPLCAAAEFRDTNVVRMLLDAGANVDGEDKNGRPALSYTAKRGEQDLIKMLLNAKADPNGGSRDKPLLVAIASKDTGSAELLLAAGADVEKAGPFDILRDTSSDYQNNEEHITPLWLAIHTQQAPMVKLLLKYRADPNETTTDGESLMFRATGDPAVLTTMLEGGGNVNARTKSNVHETVLDRMAYWHEVEAAGILLGHGADPNLRDDQGLTALHWALQPQAVQQQPKDAKVVQLLLNHGADPNVRNAAGFTPLMWANNMTDKTMGGEIAGLLRQHGALDKLPDWDRMMVSRPETHFSWAVFYKGTNDWNHFTLFETLLNFYGTPGSHLPGSGLQSITFAERLAAITHANNLPSSLAFPDLAHITIVRPSHDSTNETRIPVNLLNDAGGIDSTRDMVLEFGDVVEIPESDHPLGDTFTGLSESEKDALANPLKGQVQLVVKGKATEIAIYPAPRQALLEEILSGNNDAKAVLLSSSDLSRVKVTRHDAKTGRDQVWTVDCVSVSSMASRDPMSPEAQAIMIEANRNGSPNGGQPEWVNCLWLRNGDVIEVPEKP